MLIHVAWNQASAALFVFSRAVNTHRLSLMQTRDLAGENKLKVDEDTRKPPRSLSVEAN